MSYANLNLEDQRLVILRALNEQNDLTLNETLLQKALDLYGHGVSRQKVQSQVRWLEETGAVTVRDVQGYLIATLTARGHDHVERRSFIDEVARPAIGGS